ncbi:MAG: sugar transferase [Saprospiraceae bacterium]|nr:sugar transferase [Saprospiraceae bacterium]
MRTSPRRLGNIVYKVSDFLMALLAWALFFVYRKRVEQIDWQTDLWNDPNFYYGIFIVPLGWILFYSIFDQYKDIYRLSRMATLIRTFFLSLVGVIVLFFTLILDDVVADYRTYYSAFTTLFTYHFTLTVTARMILLTRASRRLKSGKVGFKTLIVGGNEKAIDLYKEMTGMAKSLGHQFIGFIDSNGKTTNHLEDHIPKLGQISDLKRIIEENNVEEVIIAIETSEHDRLKDILDILFDFGDKILVKIIPDMYDILLGSVKMNHIYGAVLIEIQRELMPKWQRIIKRIIDVAISAIMLLLLSPLLIFIALRVKWSSEGPILYSQERIGLNGKPFTIYKFRSMYMDAESKGPQLSHSGDSRVTPWGQVMRKWRLDELPQFWNVLIGDMSLVGPRPERRYYIEKINKVAPHYKHLLKVRPGITSWGQVKYGYASNIDQMLQRLKFDILYIENMSLSLDIKIMFYTVLVLVQGKGK